MYAIRSYYGVEYCEYHAIFYMPSSRYIRLLNDLCHGCAACSVACESGAIENSRNNFV